MLKSLERQRLARVAVALNKASQSKLPPLVLMTDDERLPDPLTAAKALPRGSMVVVRARQSSHRAKLARSLQQISRARSLVLLIANDPELADRLGVQGLHLSESNGRQACEWRARRPHWVITAAAHSFAGGARARRHGADVIFLSSVFATASHQGRQQLGAARARMMARQLPLPVYVLGGMDWQSATLLKGAPFAGIAAIGALAF
jgi:thiamine-phosphate pyrophosphorylase